MKGFSIDCRPSLTEDHLQQLHAAMMNMAPGQSVTVALSHDDSPKIPDVIVLMNEAGLETKADYNDRAAVVTGRKNVN